MSKERHAMLLIAAMAALWLLATAPTAMGATPAWTVSSRANADYFLNDSPEDPGVYTVEAENSGGKATVGEVTVKDILPAGVTVTGIDFVDSELSEPGNAGPDLSEYVCTTTANDPPVVECKFPGALSGFGITSLQRHGILTLRLRVEVDPGTFGPLQNLAQVSGGGAASVEQTASNLASSSPPPFGILHLNSEITDASGAIPYTQAGGHPYRFVTEYHFETYSSASIYDDFTGHIVGGESSVRDPMEIFDDLPPGLLVNPQGVPRCSLARFFIAECSENEDRVGTALIDYEGAEPRRPHEQLDEGIYPIFNLQPGGEYPGQLGITIMHLPVVMITSTVRTGSDYGVRATSVAAQADINRVRLTFWGVPADEGHDAARGGPAEVPPTPFVIMPTECTGSELPVVGRYNTWQVPSEFAEASVNIPAVDGCSSLSFEPSIEARPTTNIADAPSGLELDVHVPQNADPEGVATPALKDTVLRLPPGLTLNPAAGEGLEGCTEAEVGLHSEGPARCPDASKLGTVEVDTPLLNEPLGKALGENGSLYLATPYENPSGSLLAAYLVIEGQGVKIKLAGEIEADKTTGQLTTRFLGAPQLPFEDLKVRLFPGARGAFRTPPECGTYETTAELTPSSAPESGPPWSTAATFATSATESGGACPLKPNELGVAPRLLAGTESPQAGIYSPFSLRLVRDSGTQELTGLETRLPEGLVGKLAGIPYCPDAAIAAASGKSGAQEKAAPSCPAASEVGTVSVGSGAGPTPIYVQGHVYLAGPYKGAPLSVAIITPATAGPFDLGTVVVRAALYVNPETTQITARSDEVPHILEGIPLDIRSVTIKLNRPSFTRNPTNCTESEFTGSATSLLGVITPLAQRFQVGGCPALSFRPKISLRVRGKTRRSAFPALTAVVTMPEGGANIASAQVALPHGELVEQGHFKQTCTRPQLASHTCPPESVYGHARAFSPLLSQPLEGPVYLVTGFGYTLPALVADLNGQIEVQLHGKVDTSPQAGIRNTFEVVPDAPVSKFVLNMRGGKKGLLVNSVNVCQNHKRAQAVFTGQNSRKVELNPRLKARCGRHRKHAKHRHSAPHNHRTRRIPGGVR